MDVILSIVAGLGLRIFLITTSGSRDKLTAALLGIWEGVIVHQLSARSRSPHLDHVLAYVLRLVADLLISKNFLRLFMVLLWTAFGSIVSEAVSPYASISSALRRRRDREKERERERRHRHYRSTGEELAILSTPPPLRVRTSRPSHSELHPLLSQPPQQSSPPLISSFPPQTPPSFFLHGTSEIDSPSPKPVHLQLLQPADSPTQDSLPVRPRSGLASILERSPNSSSLFNAHNLLPTPPESFQSAVPLDAPDVQNNSADVYDTTKTLSRLSPIAEISSPDITPPETENKTENKQPASSSPLETIFHVPPPVFNTTAYHSFPLLTSPSTKQNHDEIFSTPFSPTMSPAAPIPVPIPRLNRQDPVGQTHAALRIDLNTDHENDNSPDSDELQTPGLRDALNVETDNENDDPLLTPIQMNPAEGLDSLSPLGLNVNSGLGTQNYIHFSDIEGGSSDPLPDTLTNNEVFEELHVPGSLSQNLLQAPSGSFPPHASPVPPSPSTIFSDITMLSQLSTRVPSKLFLKADEYRKQARQEEQSRDLLDTQRKAAEAQGRTAEALMLKIRLRELDERAYKLHEKAARRYYAG